MSCRGGPEVEEEKQEDELGAVRRGVGGGQYAGD